MTTTSLHDLSAHEIHQVAEFVAGLEPSSPLTILLHQVIAAAQRGADVSVVTSDKDLTPNDAADLLRVSRPHLVKMMDHGHLAFHYVGTHRRIRVPDLLDFIERQERGRATVAHALGTPGHAARGAGLLAPPLTEDDVTALRADLPLE